LARELAIEVGQAHMLDALQNLTLTRFMHWLNRTGHRDLMSRPTAELNALYRGILKLYLHPSVTLSFDGQNPADAETDRPGSESALSVEDLESIHEYAAAGRPHEIRWTNHTMLLVLAELARLGDLLNEREAAAVERMADKLLNEMRLNSAGVRNGTWEMDLAEAREMAALYVGMCRPLLGDAQNYTETPVGPFPKESVSLTVKIAESPDDWYILTVQRKWGKTPHELRKQAEAERDLALAQVAELQAQLAELKPQYAFTYDDGYGIEETSLVYTSEEDAREAARPHHPGAPIITRLASEWRPVSSESEV
jgi:hypothetical protein